MTEQDTTPTFTVEPPTEPGFYHYDGGNQNMIFLLHDKQWWTIFDNTTFDKCEWGYIEQALGVYNLRKLKPSVPDDWRVLTNLPVFLPGNNRNFETLQGRAGITHDGKIIVTLLKEEMADELVEMSKKNLLLQIAVDYRLPLDQLEKINNQFAMDVPADRNKVREIMADAMANSHYSDDDETIRAMLDALKDAGIKFMEEK